MSAVKLVAVFSQNKQGQLARVTKTLADHGVNIRWVAIATTPSFGVIKLLADPWTRALEALKAEGRVVSLTEVLAVEVDDRPGGLHAVAECLAQNGVNVENASGFVVGKRAVLLLELQDVSTGAAILARHGWRLFSAEETMTL